MKRITKIEKDHVLEALSNEFRTSLNGVVFGDPAGKEYVEHLNQTDEKD